MGGSTDTPCRGTGGTCFLDALEASLASEPECPRSGRVCVFGTDVLSIAGGMVSDHADEAAAVPIPLITEGRVPGWVGPEVDSVILSDRYDGEVQDLVAALRSRGSRVHVIGRASINIQYEAGEIRSTIPDGVTGMSEVGYALGILASIVQSMGVCDVADVLRESVQTLRGFSDSCAVVADTVSCRLEGRVCAVYSTSDMQASSRFWRACLVRSEGDIAFYGELPEFDHNELVGWSDPNVHAPEMLMTVIRGFGRSGMVEDIVNSMLEVLDENGREVLVADVPGGPAMLRDCCAAILAESVFHGGAGQ